MPEHCILKAVADKMKRDVKSGAFDIRAMYDMTSEQRRTMLQKYSSPDLASYINGKFEEAMVSKQKGALQEWANETFNPKQKNAVPYTSVLGKIDKLDELGVLNPKSSDAYLDDLVANKMGVYLQPDEIKGITDRAQTLQTTFEQKDQNGNPTIDYWKARDDMDKYLERLNPTHPLGVITDPIRRSNILFHISGVLKKTMSELQEGSLQASARRFSNLLTGESVNGLNNEFARQTIFDNMQTVIHTGYNPLLMQELKDNANSFAGEERPHAQGPGPLRAYARTMSSLIQHMYNTPAQFFASLSWTDTANLLSSQLANGDSVKALEYFKDATKIVPETPEGQEIRMRAMEEGLKASFQNKGALSSAALKLRDSLDKITGEFNLGKQLIPIAKVPANAIGRGLDYAGFGLIRAFHTEGEGIFSGWNRLPEAIKELKAGNKVPMQGIVQQFVQSGLGLALAAIVVHNLNPDDYIPSYAISSNNDKSLKGINNGIYNSIKLGSRYVALSFMGPLAVPIMAGLVAKKEGSLGYVKGIASALEETPGVSAVEDIFKSASEIGSKSGYQNITRSMMNSVSDYLTSIAVPSELKEVAAGTDTVQRNTEGNPLAKAENKLPGLRETLPPKINEVTGQPEKEEGLASKGIMGANLSTPESDQVVKEIDRLSTKGQSPTVGNIEYSSPRIKSLLKQSEGSEAFNDLGKDKLTGVVQYYGRYYHSQASQAMDEDDYREGNDEEKKYILNDIHKEALDETLDHFGYIKPEKKK